MSNMKTYLDVIFLGTFYSALSMKQLTRDNDDIFRQKANVSLDQVDSDIYNCRLGHYYYYYMEMIWSKLPFCGVYKWEKWSS